MRHGETVAAFEREFANYVGAKHAIAMTNGTVTLEVALRAMGVKPGERVATTPLTMAATSIAILNVGAVPVFRDVDRFTWLVRPKPEDLIVLPVELYGLCLSNGSLNYRDTVRRQYVYDGAQTLKTAQKYEGKLVLGFRSYSFQRSKILNTGEGGMLVTDDEALAATARSIASLGYKLTTSSHIDKDSIKRADAIRHVRYPSMNARMNDATANVGLMALRFADQLAMERRHCAALYAQAIEGFEKWVTPQLYSPDRDSHNYWCYTIAVDTPEHARTLQDEVAACTGERPYAAWRLTYHEPAFAHLTTSCPVAEDLQPRLLQFQTNDRQSAERNARALRTALQRLSPP